MSIKEDIERKGYVVVRSIFTAEEIARLRSSLLEHFAGADPLWHWEGLGKHQQNAAIEIPAIDWALAHPRIVATLQDLFGQKDVLYTTNCDAHMDMLSWWHKDVGGAYGRFPESCFANDDCRIYRVGIYLQNHADDATGMTVRTGSQRTPSIAEGKAETLSTQAGDVVFFDARLTHAGQFADPFETLMLRGGRFLRSEPFAARIKSLYRWLRGKQQKLSIFATYAAPGPFTDEYCRCELSDKQSRLRPESVHLAPGFVERLNASGLRVPPAFQLR